jgi:hypothetical protein
MYESEYEYYKPYIKVTWESARESQAALDLWIRFKQEEPRLKEEHKARQQEKLSRFHYNSEFFVSRSDWIKAIRELINEPYDKFKAYHEWVKNEK